MISRLPLLLAGLLWLPASIAAPVGDQATGQTTGQIPVAAQDTDQDRPAPWEPNTGDAVVDARLADINLYAQRFPDAFVDELVRYFDAPRPLMQELLGKGTHGGDLFYACALAWVTGRPCRGVIETWQADGGQGWEAVARRLGVEPGDERARRLRAGIGQSYARWGRPLPGR
jgi:hypothetical protein